MHLVRHKKSGKTYHLEDDVLEANRNEPRPYVYVWRTGDGERSVRSNKSKPVWCFLDSLEFVERQESCRTKRTEGK